MGLRRILAFTSIYALWGGSYVAIRSVIAVIPPFLAAGIRYTLAGLLLCCWSFGLRRCERPTRKQVLNALVIGIAVLGLSFGAIFWAETRLPSWTVGVLSATTFAWTYIGECVLDRIPRNWSVLSVALAGLLGIPFMLAPQGILASGMLWAVATVLFSTWMWSAALLTINRIDLPANCGQTAAIQLSSAGLFLLACSRIHDNWALVSLESARTWKPTVAMAYLVLGPSLIAFTAFHWLLRRERPHLVATHSYVNPLVAMLAGVLLLHERFSPRQLIGAGALITSICCIWIMAEKSPVRRIGKRARTLADPDLISNPKASVI